MNYILTILSGLVLFISTSYADINNPKNTNESIGIQWHEYSQTVFDDAKKAGHPVMLFALSDGCPWCRQLEDTTFKNSSVIKIINERFYPVILHADIDGDIADKYQITGVPTIIFFDSEGKDLKTFEGYSNPDEMLKNIKDMILVK